jgi:hypothetical protein
VAINSLGQRRVRYGIGGKLLALLLAPAPLNTNRIPALALT